jgi:hypothetical protein
MDIRDHKTDKAAAEKGKWFEYDNSRFLIAAHGSPAYQKAALRHGKKNRRAIQRENIEAINGMTVEVMADAVLLGWEGVKNGDVDYPYSRANAVALLSTAMEFRNWVESQAMNLANFIEEMEVADVATLKSGTSVGAGVGRASGLSGSTGSGGSGSPDAAGAGESA